MIYVVATAKRPAIVLEALKHVPHQVCWTTDYSLPKDWKPLPEYGSLVQNQVGAMRCWRGHQDALKMFLDSNNDVALVMEDDAWPNLAMWTTVAALAMNLLEEFEAVSLHGRAFRHQDFDSRPLDPQPLRKKIADILEDAAPTALLRRRFLLRRGVIDHPDLAHVRHIKKRRLRPAPQVFLDHARRVLHGHIPTAKIDHFRAEGEMQVIQRRTLSHGFLLPGLAKVRTGCGAFQAKQAAFLHHAETWPDRQTAPNAAHCSRMQED